MTEAVIVDAIRTPGGKRNGKLKDQHPAALAAHVLNALTERNNLDPELVDDVIMGCVMQAGAQSLNVGRNAVLAAGWPESVPSTTGIGQIELLEAGEVWVGAAGTEATLAPHAFPTVTDQISGVLYASRGRSASAFPAASQYAVRTAGGPSIPSISITREAPLERDTVTVGGMALGEVKEIGVGSPIDVTWGVGASGDVVIAELATADRVIACAFRDDMGSGTIPAGRLDKSGAGRFSLQRIRTASFRTHEIDFGELTFQFELGTSVTFKP